MPYNPNVARVSPEAGAESEQRTRQPDENLEVTPEQKARTAKLRKKDEVESRGKVEEIQAELSLEQLQRKLGIKKLKDPEAMLHAVILDREVTPAKLEAVKGYMENLNASLAQSLSGMEQGPARIKTQRRIEANFNLIAKVEDAIHMIEAEGAKDKEDASRILNRELMRDMNIEQGAADAIFNLESEQASLNTEQDALEKKVSELTGGMSPSQYMEDLRNRSTGLPMIGHRARAWFAKISGSENVQSMVEKWRENNRRLTQLESNLIEIKPPKTEQAPMYTPVEGEAEYEQVQPEDIIEEIEHLGPEDVVKAPRPMTREEMAANPEYKREQARKASKLIEAPLRKLEQRKAEIDSELADVEAQIKPLLEKMKNRITPESSKPYAALRKRREALKAELGRIEAETLKLMGRLPPTFVESEPEITDEEILPEEEEVSGVRERVRATPPPVSESPAIKERKAKAEEERMRREAEEAFEARKKQEAEMEAQAEYNKNVNKSKEILGEARAAEIMDGVFTQMGLRLTGEEIKNNTQLWGKADQEQRSQAVNFVFKCADRQAAIIGGETRLQKKIEKELDEMAKAMGIADAKLAYEASGRAGVGVTLETGRAEQSRTSARSAGTVEAARGRTRARRMVNESAPIEAISTEQAEAEDAFEEAVAGYEARKKQEEEEKLMSGAKAGQAAVDKAEETINKLKESTRMTAEVGKRMMIPMSIERTAAAVPKAKELWDLVAKTMEEKIEYGLVHGGPKTSIDTSVIRLSGEPGFKEHKDESQAATAYVMAMGRYLEAVNEPAPDHVIRTFGERVDRMNKLLGLEGNALVQSIMAERGKKSGKPVTRNTPSRGKETTSQQARRAARVE